MRRLLADVAVGILTSPAVSRVFAPATAGTVTTFVLHRVTGPGLEHEGMSRDLVLDALRRLLADGYHFISLDQLISAGPDGAALGHRLVALTADDGYIDQAEILAPLVIELGIPLTIFLTTGFIDGQQVNWWDRVGYAITTTERPWLDVRIGSRPVSLDLSSPESRRQAIYEVLALGKAATDEERRAAVAAVVAAAEVDIPPQPFGPFRPLSWDAARRLESTGLVSFGPHTVTHPILSKVVETQVAHEVTTSWRRLTEELAQPLPVFCYPNGDAGDFGSREIAVVRSAGLRAAVTVDCRPTALADLVDEERRFRLGRVPFPGSVAKVVQRASGIDHLGRWRGRVG